MTTSATVHVRVDQTTKDQAALALGAMGLSVSDAVRALLTRVAVEKQLPFALRVPNTETVAAMKEARSIVAGRFNSAQALFDALEQESH